jgi:hypothetical protein
MDHHLAPLDLSGELKRPHCSLSVVSLCVYVTTVAVYTSCMSEGHVERLALDWPIGHCGAVKCIACPMPEDKPVDSCDERYWTRKEERGVKGERYQTSDHPSRGDPSNHVGYTGTSLIPRPQPSFIIHLMDPEHRLHIDI